LLEDVLIELEPENVEFLVNDPDSSSSKNGFLPEIVVADDVLGANGSLLVDSNGLVPLVLLVVVVDPNGFVLLEEPKRLLLVSPNPILLELAGFELLVEPNGLLLESLRNGLDPTPLVVDFVLLVEPKGLLPVSRKGLDPVLVVVVGFVLLVVEPKGLVLVSRNGLAPPVLLVEGAGFVVVVVNELEVLELVVEVNDLTLLVPNDLVGEALYGLIPVTDSDFMKGFEEVCFGVDPVSSSNGLLGTGECCRRAVGREPVTRLVSVN